MEAVTPSRPRATYRDLLALPEHVTAELIDGELFVMPRPRVRHAAALSTMTADVSAAFGRRRPRAGPGGWVILVEPELHLGPRPDKLAPDLAGWRRERMPDALGPEDAPAHYDLAPDWACEVLSPRTEATDRAKKMRIFRREGVGHVWLVNPIERTLEVYRLEGGRYALLDTFEGEDVVRAEPFDAIELALGLLWQG